jgi:histidinol-phosphate/aromatic aminotransferase/cobyric acid decarboxylase-like protein
VTDKIVAPPAHGGYGRVLGERYGIDASEMIDLSVSVNPFAPDIRGLLKAIIEDNVMGRYPDQIDIDRATDALRTTLGSGKRKLLITAGGAEAIALVSRAIRVCSIGSPEFSLYERYVEKVEAGAVLFCSDPNNPLGTNAKRPPTTTPVIWDEAFFPLARGMWTRGDYGPFDLVVGSLTKTFSCPGLRLGYVLFPDDTGNALHIDHLYDQLLATQTEWSRTPLSLIALPEMLATATLGLWHKRCLEQKTTMETILFDCGYETLETTVAPWLLVTANDGFGDALAREGVAVRDCQSFGMEGTWRMGLPKDEQISAVQKALDSATDSATDRAIDNARGDA